MTDVLVEVFCGILLSKTVLIVRVKDCIIILYYLRMVSMFFFEMKRFIVFKNGIHTKTWLYTSRNIVYTYILL